jgi:hypothetical protein
MNETKNVSTTAVRWATYSGDLTETAVGQKVGPNTLGEKLVAVSAVYDPVHNQTRVGYAYIPRSES